MKIFTRHTLVIGIFSSITLSSCSNMSDSTVTRTQGTVGGAAVGAGAAAGIGGMLGFDSSQMVTAMAIGGLVGGIVGNQWAASVVKKKEAYASAEDYLNANIKQLQTRNSQIADLNEDLTEEIADLRAKKTSISKSEAAELSKSLAAKKGLVEVDIKTAKSALSGAQGEKRAELQKQIALLENQRATLVKNTSNLMSISRRTV